MASWMLGPQAQKDLRDIRHYTERTWGIAQSQRYRAQLRECADRLAADPKYGKLLENLPTNLRFMRCQHHYIFCVFDSERPPLIVAILHERMDFVARIAERLG